ncbi:MAG: tRNA pseudouridine(13) synthase TruD [Anaerolineae bacterium]
MLNWEIPYLTPDLPGIGGKMRVEIDDFIVEEVPAYDPCGEGEHTFFGVEKRDISTLMLIKQIAQALEVSEREIGSAGLKDARAVARQTLSVQWVPPEKILALTLDKAQVLWAKRHTNKLRSGHLRGNRFTLRLRDVVPEAEVRAAAIVDQLLARGVPNGYGRQRFGNRGNNHEMGLLLLRNDRAALRTHGIYHLSYKMRQFLISALQSALFNTLLAVRIERGLLDDVLPGDVARKEDTGGIFIVEDVAAERPRVRAWEISATGPIYGYKMLAAQAEAGALEDTILEEAGIAPMDFRPFKAKGSRRPLRYYPEGLSWQMEGPDVLTLSFFAPKGAYATLLLRELMKTEVSLEEEDAADGGDTGD